MSIVHEFTGVLNPIQNIKLIGTLTDNKGVLNGSLNPVQGSLSGNLVSSNHYLLTGTLTLPPEADSVYYEGDYIVTPKPFDETVLDTSGLKMYKDVTILEIPYFETSNESGYTIYIGEN